MGRSFNPNLPGLPPYGSVIPGTAVWTDYDGDVVYGDYVANFDANNQFTGLTDTKAYLPGLGEAASSPGLVTPSYYHADQIGSLRLATDGTGHVVGRYVYTAFGEPILEDGGAANTAALRTRYRFGGAWQYETGLGADETGNDPLPFIRIGHRWYDPSTGRFLQRDPIGINGGLNVYEYCDNSPIIHVDPEGLHDDGGWERVYRMRDKMSDKEREKFDKANATIACVGLIQFGGPMIVAGGKAAASRFAPWWIALRLSTGKPPPPGPIPPNSGPPPAPSPLHPPGPPGVSGNPPLGPGPRPGWPYGQGGVIPKA